MRGAIRTSCIGAAIVLSLLSDVGAVWGATAGRAFAEDWAVFWPVAHHSIAETYQRMNELAFAYPPTTLLLLKPFALLPYFAALVVWTVSGLLAFMWAGHRVAGLAAAALAVLTPGCIVALLVGQMSFVIAALMMLGVTASGPIFAGIAFGAAAALKPQLAVAVPIALIASRQWAAGVWATLTAVLLVLATVVLWGTAPWLAWVHALAEFQAVVAERGLEPKGVGVNGLIAQFGLPRALYWVGAALGICSVWTAFTRAERMGRVIALVCGAALISPYMLHYDLAVIGVAGVAVLLDNDRPPLMWIGAALAISYVLAPFGLILLAVGLVNNRSGYKAYSTADRGGGYPSTPVAGHSPGAGS
jgi:hypothetical protein